MKTVGMILGILGGIIAAALGFKWLSDANSLKQLINTARQAGANMTELDKLIKAAYLLIGALGAGIIGGVLTVKGRGKVGGVVMIVGAVAPAIFAPKALVFTFILLLGGVLSLASEKKAA
jgi:hypothetical protein